VLESYSPLERFRGQRTQGTDPHPPVRLGEVSNTQLLHIAVYPGALARFAAGAAAVLGAALPESPIRNSTAGRHSIFRIAPDQFWVLGAGEPALETQLRAAIAADAGCVTSLDGARTHLFVEGPRARDLLGGLVPIDLHPTVFPVSGFAQTGIHHVAGLLLRASEDRYEFFAPRTFAVFIWEVLVDAARPFGYEILFP